MIAHHGFDLQAALARHDHHVGVRLRAQAGDARSANKSANYSSIFIIYVYIQWLDVMEDRPKCRNWKRPIGLSPPGSKTP
jgi:hypothetical protein